MTDTATTPRHLQILAEVWADLARRIDIAPAIPCETDELEVAHLDRFEQFAGEEFGHVRLWVRRIEDWINTRLAKALANPQIADVDMRRNAERLGHFADELVEYRERLRSVALDPALHSAAPRFDAIHAALLVQVKAFAAQVVDALGPQALMYPEGKRQGGTVELSFAFTPRADAEMRGLRAWLQRANDRLQVDHAWLCAEDE